MKSRRSYIPSLVCAALTLGCVVDNTGNDTQSSTTSTTSTTSGNQSGSVTSAPGSATTETASESSPTMAAATSTGSTTATSTGSTGEPCHFLSCDDMGDSPFECDNWAQDCPEGQKCTAYISSGGGWDATKCVEVTGTDKPGEPCTSEGAMSGVESCIKGAMCWGVNDEGVGACVALCTGSPEAPVCEGMCTFAAEGVLNLCFPTCDPLLQDCLGSAEACYPLNDTFICAPDSSGEDGEINDSCVFINVCDEGLMCADAAAVGTGCEAPATGCCTPFCKFPGGACPNPDQQCLQYFMEPFPLEPANSDDIGYCGLPG